MMDGHGGAAVDTTCPLDTVQEQGGRVIGWLRVSV